MREQYLRRVPPDVSKKILPQNTAKDSGSAFADATVGFLATVRPRSPGILRSGRTQMAADVSPDTTTASAAICVLPARASLEKERK